MAIRIKDDLKFPGMKYHVLGESPPLPDTVGELRVTFYLANFGNPKIWVVMRDEGYCMGDEGNYNFPCTDGTTLEAARETVYQMAVEHAKSALEFCKSYHTKFEVPVEPVPESSLVIIDETLRGKESQLVRERI